MKIVLILIYVVAMLGIMFSILSVVPKKLEQRIDCSMASFHPDFTPEMRKACNDRLAKQ